MEKEEEGERGGELKKTEKEKNGSGRRRRRRKRAKKKNSNNRTACSKRTLNAVYPSHCIMSPVCALQGIYGRLNIAATVNYLFGAQLKNNNQKTKTNYLHHSSHNSKARAHKINCVLTKRMKFSKKRTYLVHIPISLLSVLFNNRRRKVNPLCL